MPIRRFSANVVPSLRGRLSFVTRCLGSGMLRFHFRDPYSLYEASVARVSSERSLGRSRNNGIKGRSLWVS